VAGLREAKKLETRARIVAAALQLFAKQGYGAATVDDIARAARVSTRSFFHYFATKEDVLLGDETELLAGLVADVRAAPAGELAAPVLWDALERLAARFDTDAATLRPRYTLILDEPAVHARSLALQLQWEDQVATALSNRLTGPNRQARAQLLAAAGLACLRVSARQWATTDRPRSMRALVALARRALEADLASPTATPRRTVA
jgi:AcrR family transcriptional regulator